MDLQTSFSNIYVVNITGPLNGLPSSNSSIPNGSNYGDYLFWNSNSGAWGIGSDNISLGVSAGQINQGLYSVAIGNSAGNINQQDRGIAIGNLAASTGQGISSVAIGDNAGREGQNDNCIAIGTNAGSVNQGITADPINGQAIAIGYRAGETNQGDQSVSLGTRAGNLNQHDYSVSIGYYAGSNEQSTGSIAIGKYSGSTTQGLESIAIGNNAGNANQGNYSIAIGRETSITSQGVDSLSIGSFSGNTSQGNNSIALGYYAGYNQQGNSSIAIGQGVGLTTQGTNSIAIGQGAGNTSQGAYSIAIGNNAGQTNQPSQSIIINASSSTGLNASTGGLFINPIREMTGPNSLFYNPSTNEISYSTLYNGPQGHTGPIGPIGGTNGQIIFNNSNEATGSNELTFDAITSTLSSVNSNFTGTTTMYDSVVTNTFDLNGQTFYSHGADGFSVNENFDAGNSNVTAYHFTSGNASRDIMFSIAKTDNFTNMFGTYGSPGANTFVIGSETQGNTTFEIRSGLGIAGTLNLAGGDLLLQVANDGQLYAPFLQNNTSSSILSYDPSNGLITYSTGPQSLTGPVGPQGPTSIVQNTDGPIGFLVENLSTGTSSESTYILKNDATNELYSYLLSSSENSNAVFSHRIINSNTGSFNILSKNSLKLISGANDGEIPNNEIQLSKTGSILFKNLNQTHLEIPKKP